MIILISGKQGSGKSSVATKLCASYLAKGLPCTILNYADVIYKIHNFALETLEWHGVSVPTKDGKLLQLLGTDWGRATYGQNVWVDCLMNKIQSLLIREPKTVVIIADARFENELLAPQKFKNFVSVRLDAPEDVRKARCNSWRENTNHPSETGLDSFAEAGYFDFYFETENTSTERIVEILLKEIKNPDV